MSIKTIARIEEQDYEELREMVGEDSVLPRTYAEWEIKTAEYIRQYSERGDTVKYASVSSSGFQEYLRSSGLAADHATFGVYVVSAS